MCSEEGCNDLNGDGIRDGNKVCKVFCLSVNPKHPFHRFYCDLFVGSTFTQ